MIVCDLERTSPIWPLIHSKGALIPLTAPGIGPWLPRRLWHCRIWLKLFFSEILLGLGPLDVQAEVVDSLGVWRMKQTQAEGIRNVSMKGFRDWGSNANKRRSMNFCRQIDLMPEGSSPAGSHCPFGFLKESTGKLAKSFLKLDQKQVPKIDNDSELSQVEK